MLMKRSLTAAVLVLVVYASCLAQKAAQRTSAASLAKPVDWGVYSRRLFSDAGKVKFTLVTSWIPGENHKGMMRYKMTAVPDDSDTPAADPNTEHEARQKLMTRVSACAVTLNLYDPNEFLLRNTVVPFHLGVDEQVRVRSLNANSSLQMDAQEYREFVGTAMSGGSWNVSWDCGPQLK